MGNGPPKILRKEVNTYGYVPSKLSQVRSKTELKALDKLNKDAHAVIEFK